jgi:hypothetical protein
MRLAESELTWQDVVDPPFAWATLAKGPEKGLDDFQAISPMDVDARIVRGQHCHSFADLGREWAAALQFPWYFGHNWDAFDECINDLEWFRCDRVAVLISRVEEVLIDEPDDFAGILLPVLQSAERTPGAPRKPSQAENLEGPSLVRFVFQYEDERVTERFLAFPELPLTRLPLSQD